MSASTTLKIMGVHEIATIPDANAMSVPDMRVITKKEKERRATNNNARTL